jgi:flagellar basal body rod protein FlgC
MALDAVSSGLAGIAAASRRIGVAAHNIANLLTENLRPLRAHQLEGAQGLPVVEVEQAAQPEEVRLERELVDSELASVQFRASLRAIDTQLDLEGRVIDLLA